MREFLKRVLPDNCEEVILETIPAAKDYYEYGARDGKVYIVGADKVCAAKGLYEYLKAYCRVDMGWCGERLPEVDRLPLPERSVRMEIEQKHRVYFNYCTLGYSCAWWDWERWQKEIDFMALNGINMPLTVIGYEVVWYETLLEFGYGEREALECVSSPIFMPWQLMTNIIGYFPPSSKEYIYRRSELGKRILEREIELGMTPVQQAFSGHVPASFVEKFPNSNIQVKKSWCNFPETRMIDPLDPLFTKMGRALMEKQREKFGEYHYYAADPFHEGEPPEKSQAYLSAVGKAVSDMISAHDDKGIWVMQSWSLREHIVKAVPRDRLLIFDINGRKARNTKNFWGYPFVTGNINNFGGNIHFQGDVKALARNEYAVRRKKGANVMGSGLFMEAINNNPLYFAMNFDIVTQREPLDMYAWIKDYADRRYGGCGENIYRAVRYLAENVYVKGTTDDGSSSIICARPALKPKRTGIEGFYKLKYDNRELATAAKLMLAERDKCKRYAGYRYDIVDIVRQVLSNLAAQYLKRLRRRYKSGDNAGYSIMRAKFRQLLLDVDELLSYEPMLSLCTFLDEARKCGATEEEREYNVKCTRAILTIWGPLHEPYINDYSWREWGGLIKDYYLPRWEMFFDMIEEEAKKGKKYTGKNLPLAWGKEAFRADDFYSSLADFELKWLDKKGYDGTTEGDVTEFAARLMEKYGDDIEEYI